MAWRGLHVSRPARLTLKARQLVVAQAVYTRVCRGQDAADKHVARVEKNLPPEGTVRALQVTDRQFARMKLLVGMPTRQERIGTDQLVLL